MLQKSKDATLGWLGTVLADIGPSVPTYRTSTCCLVSRKTSAAAAATTYASSISPSIASFQRVAEVVAASNTCNFLGACCNRITTVHYRSSVVPSRQAHTVRWSSGMQ